MIEKLIMWWVRRWSTSSLTRLEVHLRMLKLLRKSTTFAAAHKVVMDTVPSDEQQDVIRAIQSLDSLGYTLTKKD